MSSPWTLRDGRVLDLLTPMEFQALPDGTELLAIDGTHAIVGKGECYEVGDGIVRYRTIDMDTRRGHLAWGVLRPPTPSAQEHP